MGHHGYEEFDFTNSETYAKMGEVAKNLKVGLDKLVKDIQPKLDKLTEVTLGLTGEFPDGKIVDGDSGEIAYNLSLVDGRLVINFGSKPICWIGFTLEQVKGLRDNLEEKIKEMEGLLC